MEALQNPQNLIIYSLIVFSIGVALGMWIAMKIVVINNRSAYAPPVKLR